MRKGAQTLVFESKPVILSHAAIGGKKEGEGPLAAYFDFLGKDAKLSQKTFEKAESKLQELALDTAKRKLGVSYEDIDVLFAGDLLNQVVYLTHQTCSLWRVSAAHDPKLQKPVRYWPKLKRGISL